MSDTTNPDRKASDLEEIRLEIAMIMLGLQESKSKLITTFGRLNQLGERVGRLIDADKVAVALEADKSGQPPRSYSDEAQAG